MNPRPLRLCALLAALSACGPNFRYVYDSEVSFERCYSEDFNTSSDATVRTRCWQAFLQSYTYGASADHVAYARERIAHPESTPSNAIQRSANGPVDPPPNAPSAQSDRAITGPMAAPSSGAQAPLAAVPTEARSGPSASGATPAEPPGSACSNDCRGRWSTCSQACQTTDAACVAACDDTFRDCMRGCF